MASHRGIVFTALTWNLFHGRDHPPEEGLHTWRSRILRRTERGERYAQVNRSLRGEFVAKLAGWDWDVALLQEAPPRWSGALCDGTGATGERVLTSRNSFGAARSAIAEWNPDLIASGEGGSNVILVRPPWRLVGAEIVALTTTPERRAMVIARMERPDGPGLTVACTHLSVPATGQGATEALAGAAVAARIAGGGPLLFGGDLNLRPRHDPEVFEVLAEQHGLAPATAPGAIDHLLASGLDVVSPPAELAGEARDVAGPDGLLVRLSDHSPVLASFRMR